VDEARNSGSWRREGALGLAGEPRIEYQPIIDLGSGRLLGFEALLRWHHPTEGLIPPNLLIPWAEANGDIVGIGAWVLTEGCQHAQKWPVSLQLAVNCSLVQLRVGAASIAVRAALEASGLEPDRLTIEVTEHAMADEAAVADLRAIAALGALLAVDDVGTSWTSFDLLRRMDVNTVKIDGSFVGGLEPQHGINRMVVETVVHLAHSSGMATVAEGVENEVTAAIVREFDSDAAQGYFFAPPLHSDVATQMANSEDFRFPLEGRGWTDAVGLFEFSPPAPAAVLETNGHSTAGASPAEALVDAAPLEVSNVVEDHGGTNGSSRPRPRPRRETTKDRPDGPTPRKSTKPRRRPAGDEPRDS